MIASMIRAALSQRLVVIVLALAVLGTLACLATLKVEEPVHTGPAAPIFKSIAEGARWTYRADRRGRFAYTCTFHPNMNGTLVVT